MTDKKEPITFTYNGMLKTNEIAGEGNSFHTEFRGYDPRLGRFFAQDRLGYFYPSTSSYVFALDNPIIGKDDNGLLTIYVNGYRFGQKPGTKDDLPDGRSYWNSRGSQFIKAARSYFNDDGQDKYVDGSGSTMLSQAWDRQSKGRTIGKKMAQELIKEILEHNKTNPEDPITELNFVTHSMGAAVAEGMIEEFMKHPQLADLLKKGEVVHLSAADANEIVISENSKMLDRTQLNYQGDLTLKYNDPGSFYYGGWQIDGVKNFGVVKSDVRVLHPKWDPNKKWDFHFDSKTYDDVWNFVRSLKSKSNNDSKAVFLEPEEGLKNEDEQAPILGSEKQKK